MQQTRRLRSNLAFVLAIAFALFAMPTRDAHADSMHDFITSCSYGVLAGTLVGAATLAFTDNPGANLNKVARGASLGLYAGIILGLYVVYGSSGDSEEAAKELDRQTLIQPPRLNVYPLISDRGFEGLGAQMRVLSF